MVDGGIGGATNLEFTTPDYGVCPGRHMAGVEQNHDNCHGHHDYHYHDDHDDHHDDLHWPLISLCLIRPSAGVARGAQRC